MSDHIVSIRKLERRLPKTLARERLRFRREITRIKKSLIPAPKGEKTGRSIDALDKSMARSMEKRRQRIKNLPELTFDPDLPITKRREEIIEKIRANRVLVIAGETGSGKTTQLPKLCLAAGRGIDGRIACTQPRRIAATSVSRRIAEELKSEPGKHIGYKIRFQDKTSPDAYIKMMTDGMLLAETLGDPFLNEYDTIIVDEAHERSLNIDFILGILRNLLKRRRDLKVIITSATIDTEKFSKAFDDAPVIEVSGRTFPVEVRYQPHDPEGEKEEEPTCVEMAVNAVTRLQTESPYGDILVFMPTEQDIKETCEMLEARLLHGRVLPLYARLTAARQAEVFARGAGRKIIVATNVAETSLTIPGIKFVIDTGLARIASYNPGTRTTALPVMPVSRSSCDQRKGRCGRVENGVCIRLYSEEEYNSRPLYTLPEILRSNLAEVILRMISLKLSDIASFPFVDRPHPRSIKDGFDTLFELDAITEKRGGKSKRRYLLTDNGRVMAKLPVDPKLARMLIEAKKLGCLNEMKVIVSALSIQDPRERPVEKAQQADQKHALFKDPASDFITLLNIWNLFHEKRKEVKTWSRLKKFCLENFISFRRMREFRDIHNQISLLLKEQGFTGEGSPLSCDPASGREKFGLLYTAIHKSILAGYLSNIAIKKEKNTYQAAKGRNVMLFPGSGLFNKAGSWVVAGEIVETSRVFARIVADIDPSWLEEVGKNQCRRTHSDPHWEKRRGEVVAKEQVTLYGLVIVSGRAVSYGKINPEEASEIFIRSALVEGEINFGTLPKNFTFIRHNQDLMDNIRGMEDRVRRRDILVSEAEVFEFYRERLSGFSDIRSLAKFLRGKKNDDFLKMTDQDLLRYAPDPEELSLYPDSLKLGHGNFKCEYRFDPDKKVDGLTVKIPAEVAGSVPAEPMDWLVPGLYKEKITALIKGLPKEYRKRLVPVANTVEVIAREMAPSQGNLVTELGRFIHKRFGVDIPATLFLTGELPEHLKMRISIVDGKGRVIRSGRDRSILRQEAGVGSVTDGFSAAKAKWEREGITKWDFGNIEESVEFSLGKENRWVFFPALAMEKQGVALRLFKESEKAASSHMEGVSALFSAHFSKEIKSLKKELALPRDLAPRANYFGGEKKFCENLQKSVVKSLFSRNIRGQEEFHAVASELSPKIYAAGQTHLKTAVQILSAFHEARETIYRLELGTVNNRFMGEFLKERRDDLASIVPEQFMVLYDIKRLSRMASYVKAVSIRALRGVDNLEKEKARAQELAPLSAELNGFITTLSPESSEEKRKKVEEFFWMLEEYKISLFAQELRTPQPVSRKRLRKFADGIRRMV